MKIKNIISYFLVLNLLLVSFAHAETNKKIVWKKVSADELERLLQDHPELKQNRLVLNDTEGECTKIVDPLEKKKCEEKKLQALRADEPQANLLGNVEIKEETAIVFAVVGTLIIAVWIPYVAYMGYLVATKKDEINSSHNLSFLMTGVGETGNAEGESSGGVFSSLRYSFLMSTQKEPILLAGLNLELGGYNFDIRESDLTKKSFSGFYWLIGPALKFSFLDIFALKVDLLAGRSMDSTLDLFSRADIGLHMYVGAWNFGLGVSGVYLNMKEQEGLLNRHSNAGLGYHGGVGYNF